MGMIGVSPTPHTSTFNYVKKVIISASIFKMKTRLVIGEFAI
jgi:hypothetical protein